MCLERDCIASRRMASSIMTEKRKSKKEVARATLASVTKEMARPRFAESARKEEEAHHHVWHRGRESPASIRRGSEVKSGKPAIVFCRAFVSSIGVLTIGFLGVGVRAFESAGTTKFAIGAAFVVSAVILVLYFMLRGSTREQTAHSLFRESPFVRRSLLSRLCAWRPSGGGGYLQRGRF